MRILRLQLFQAAHLVDAPPAVFLAPTVIGLLADVEASSNRSESLTLAEKHLSFSQFANDLSGGEILLGQIGTSLVG
jgi:hypothetical protein